MLTSKESSAIEETLADRFEPHEVKLVLEIIGIFLFATNWSHRTGFEKGKESQRSIESKIIERLTKDVAERGRESNVNHGRTT